MLNVIKKLVPKPFLSIYHRILALLAGFIYRHPSQNLIVIGVTGTSGKSTVVYLITKLLEKAGYKVGAASTFFFQVDKKVWLNDKKMTMLGRFALQRLISQMVKANCQYAVIETTSQGIEQFRHLGINYDVLVFTNLYPEHIEAHGGFENYKRAKLKLFQKLQTDPVKLLINQKIKKIIIGNLDDEYINNFISNWAQEKWVYCLTNKSMDNVRIMRAADIKLTGQGSEFSIEHVPFQSALLGEHNVSNCVAAITACLTQGINLSSTSKNLAQIKSIPGRLEEIDSGREFKVIIDYAYEPKAVEKLYETIKLIPHNKIIHVLGSTGGGRDVARRPKLGQLAGQLADYVIVTNEDPYDDDPQEIINQVAQGAKEVGKTINKTFWKILDRRKAIAKALSLTEKDDLVLITGKGCEQAIVVKDNKKIPWDDRVVVKEELSKILKR